MQNLDLQIAFVSVQSQNTKRKLQFCLGGATDMKIPQDCIPYSKHCMYQRTLFCLKIPDVEKEECIRTVHNDNETQSKKVLHTK